MLHEKNDEVADRAVANVTPGRAGRSTDDGGRQCDEPASGADDASTPAAAPVLPGHTVSTFAQGLTDAVLIADPSGTIVVWNGAAERLFGWTAAEMTGRTMDVIIPERLRARHWEGWRRVMSTGETTYGDTLLEVPAVHRDGRPLSVAFTVSLFVEPGTGAITAVTAVLRDDTARWQQRREQREEIARLRALLASAGEGVA